MYFATENKVLIPLIILESSIYDEEVLSKGFMPGTGLCTEWVLSDMYVIYSITEMD